MNPKTGMEIMVLRLMMVMMTRNKTQYTIKTVDILLFIKRLGWLFFECLCVSSLFLTQFFPSIKLYL